LREERDRMKPEAPVVADVVPEELEVVRVATKRSVVVAAADERARIILDDEQRVGRRTERQEERSERPVRDGALGGRRARRDGRGHRPFAWAADRFFSTARTRLPIGEPQL